MDMQTIRFAVVIAAIAALYGSRMTTGAARTTPAGLSFGMKPAVVLSRLFALVLYIGFFVYTARTSQRPLPVWVYLLFAAVVLFGALQLPGTIVLGAESLSQHFWLRGTKTMRYNEVMAVQVLSAGRAIRVAGDNRVVITHTNNHAAAELFKTEMAQRTGKKIS